MSYAVFDRLFEAKAWRSFIKKLNLADTIRYLGVIQ